MITGSDCYTYFGDPETIIDEGIYMRLWKLPDYITKNIEALPRNIYCNVQMIVPLEATFLAILQKGLQDEFKTYDGCFQVRPIRGYERTMKRYLNEGNYKKAMRYYSIHSWGVAIDLNQAENGLGKEPQLSEEFVACFEENGFDWGGRWKRKDGMHFQLSYLNDQGRIFRAD